MLATRIRDRKRQGKDKIEQRLVLVLVFMLATRTRDRKRQGKDKKISQDKEDLDQRPETPDFFKIII